MNIYLGTTSEDKANILVEALKQIGISDFNINGCKVESGIVDQPLDEETTLHGARNRSRSALLGNKDGIGLGLEGGLTMVPGDDRYYLICFASICDIKGNEYFGGSSKLVLPKEVSDNIKNGYEFGIVIREYMKSLNEEDPSFNYVNELITRKRLFIEAITNSFLDYRARNI